MKLTEKEITALLVVANQGCKEIGTDSFNDLLESNQTWFTLKDLCNLTEWDKHTAAGVISTLGTKGLAEADGKDWVLTDLGIKAAIQNA